MDYHLSSSQNMDSEKKLLRLIAHSDESAFRHLFDLHKNSVYNIAHKFTHCSNTSEEIVQEVFMIVWLRRGDLQKLDNFKAYIIVITRNLVYKFLREKAKKYISVSAQENTTANDVETHLLEKEFGKLLKKAVNRLPSQQQKVYILVKENGLRREEAANILNVAPDTIKFHLAQAMKSIRAYCTLHLGTHIAIVVQAIAVAII